MMFETITTDEAMGQWYAEDEDFFDLGLEFLIRVEYITNYPGKEDGYGVEHINILTVYLNGEYSAMATIAARNNYDLKEELAQWRNDNRSDIEYEARNSAIAATIGRD